MFSDDVPLLCLLGLCKVYQCTITYNDDTFFFFFITEILKVVSAVSMFVLFFCPCCANFWFVYAHRMCIGVYFWLHLC